MLSRASSLATPLFTSIPAFLSILMPSPAVRGSGSLMPMATRAIPAAGMIAAHVGRRCLAWALASGVVWSVAPSACLPACFSATASACGRPPGAVAPRPTISPLRTMTQPTLGLGAERPRAASPSRAASSIHRRSLNGELLLELLVFFAARFLGLAPLFRRFLLVADDVGVGAVRTVILDIDDLRRRGGVDLRIDEENDDDDKRHQHRQRGGDHLFAAALPQKCRQVFQRRARTDHGRKNCHGPICRGRGRPRPVPGRPQGLKLGRRMLPAQGDGNRHASSSRKFKLTTAVEGTAAPSSVAGL